MTRVSTGDFDIACLIDGREDRRSVLLLHGWPDDASTWDEIAARLRDAGLRTIVPTTRGFGETHFLSDAAPRTANSGMLATDAIALTDALGIEQFVVAGHDWGSNAAEALAVGWPDRIEKLAMLEKEYLYVGRPKR